jgi:hypothetical protein
MRARDILFYKENLWNIVIRSLPIQYNYVLCLDADVVLTADHLAERTIAALQKAPIVQPFSRAVWTDSYERPYKDKMSVGYGSALKMGELHVAKKFHPGFALALRRDFWSTGPGFYEREPLGGGNTMFVAAITGGSDNLIQEVQKVSPALAADYAQYVTMVGDWRGTVGYIEGDAVHLWHGSTKKRRYLDRSAILTNFDPREDLSIAKDTGLLTWSSSAKREKVSMVHEVEAYFSSRDEDELFDSTA